MKKVFAGSVWAMLGIGFLSFLGGCADIKKKMGLESKLPDEFLVSPYQQALEIPPSFDLKPPQKGDARGVDPFHPKEDLLARGGSTSSGEREMMRALGAGISPEEQTSLDQQASSEKHQSHGKKGLLEGMLPGKKQKTGKVIDPVEETRRAGQTTPATDGKLK
ncbi:MAG: DUF3035 domain-containing protein [Alphaproteobacteria bacterium]